MTSESFPTLAYSLMLQDFPESLVLTLAAFSLLNLRLWERRVFYIALLQTGTNLVRLLPIAFGMHSALLLISLTVYIRAFTGARLSRVFQAVIVCFAIVAGTELLYGGPLLRLTGLTYAAAFASPFWRAAFALPYEVVLLLVALGKDYYDRKRGLIC